MVDTGLVLKPIICIIAFVEYTGNNFVVQLQCRLKVIDQMRWSDEWLCCRSVCMVRAEFRLSGGLLSHDTSSYQKTLSCIQSDVKFT